MLATAKRLSPLLTTNCRHCYGNPVLSLTAMARVLCLKDCSDTSELWQSMVHEAIDSLKNHKVIAIPTDTIYGIATLAQSKEAVEKLYEIKNRDYCKPISICVGDVDDVYRWGQVTVARSVLNELLPGPVTVVFNRTLRLNPALNPGTTLVGVRVPDYGFVRDLSRACGEPLALTSANKSSQPSTISVEEFSHLLPQLDLVFDGGTLGGTDDHSRLGSTVVDLSKPGKYTLIRGGSAEHSTVRTLEKYGLREDKKS